VLCLEIGATAAHGIDAAARASGQVGDRVKDLLYEPRPERLQRCERGDRTNAGPGNRDGRVAIAHPGAVTARPCSRRSVTSSWGGTATSVIVLEVDASLEVGSDQPPLKGGVAPALLWSLKLIGAVPAGQLQAPPPGRFIVVCPPPPRGSGS